jgi:hypothetical protein
MAATAERTDTLWAVFTCQRDAEQALDAAGIARDAGDAAAETDAYRQASACLHMAAQLLDHLADGDA